MTRTATILVIDESADARSLIMGILSDAGFRVCVACDGASGLAALGGDGIDLVLLALALPDLDGLVVLDRLRRLSDVPVIVVSRRSGEADRVQALDRGADDYVTKPFSPAELMARVRARLRRVPGHGEPSPLLSFDGLAIDPGRREVVVRGRQVALRHREFDLLAFLASSPGQVFTRRQLLAQVWGPGAEFQGRATVTEHVRHLRNRLDADGGQSWIQTVHGVGYRFDRRAGDQGSRPRPHPLPSPPPSGASNRNPIPGSVMK